MSDRWGLSSSYFRSQPQSYYSLSQLGPDALEDLQKVKIRSPFPIFCWIEKAIVLIDYFQIFSIIWQAANPYPWPYLWIQFSRPLLYLNLDIFSQTKDGALGGRSSYVGISKWGQMNGYLNYSLGFASAAALLVICYYLCLEPPNVYGQEAIFKYRAHVMALIILLAYLMYLPCTTAVFRIYYCDTETNQLAVDPSVQCWGWLHGIYLIICTICTAPLFLGLPIVIFRNARKNLIYRASVDHEKRTQIWEILYMLQLDDYWLKGQVWLISSFRLFGSFFPMHMLLLKASLLLIFIFVRDVLYFQAALMWTLLALFGVYYTSYIYPYRSLSTNIIFGVCWSMHIVNISFAVANSSNVESAVMVASTEYLILLIYNLLGYFIIFLVCCHSAFVHKVTDWPTTRTLYRIYADSDVLKKVAHWVEVMRESKVVLMDFLLTPVEIADINALEECIRMLRGSWSMAKASGSIFETPIGEMLEQLVYVHSSRLPYALRKHDHWNSAYQQAAAANKFIERRNNYYLMNDRKRRMMMKLLTYRCLQGKRAGNFSFDNVAEYKRMTAFELEMRHRKEKEEADKAAKPFSFNALGRFLRSASGLGAEPAPSGQVEEKLESEMKSEKQKNDEDRKLLNDFKDEDQEEKVLDPEMVEEARKMIERLQIRTEKALNKFHQAKKSLFEQFEAGNNRSTVNLLLNQSASSISHAGGAGLAKISTMELMRRTVDVEEQQDLEDLFHLWDDAIQLYEQEQFPGDYEKLNTEVENWYAYRGLVSQRLELIFQFLQEQHDLMNEIGGEMIEEGDEMDEESSRGGRLASDDEDDRLGGKKTSGGRLVSDNEESDRDGRLVSDDEESARGGRLVSDDEDDDYRKDDIVSTKKGIKRASSKFYREDIDDDDDEGEGGLV